MFRPPRSVSSPCGLPVFTCLGLWSTMSSLFLPVGLASAALREVVACFVAVSSSDTAVFPRPRPPPPRPSQFFK